MTERKNPIIVNLDTGEILDDNGRELTEGEVRLPAGEPYSWEPSGILAKLHSIPTSELHLPKRKLK
jgi:hypothetical protein